MISTTLRITLIIAVAFYFILVLHYLKCKMLELRYTLIWLFAGLIMAIMVIVPETLRWFIGIIGIESNMNGLFVMALAFVICITMTLTAIVSRQTMKIRSLIQEISFLEKRIRELEGMKNSENETNGKETA